MCKVLGFSNTKNFDIKGLVDVSLETLAEYEKDGLGFELVGNLGRYGQRAVGNSLKFGQGSSLDVPFLPQVAESWGKIPETGEGPAIFHSRTSTNNVSLVNTHPLRCDNSGISLIHNGVVTNHGPSYVQKTTNDTEHILHHLTTSGVEAVFENLTGYYAVLYLDNMNRLGVIRDSTAPLFASYSPSVDSWIFASSQEIIETIQELFGLEESPIIETLKDISFLIDSSNKVHDFKNIKSRGYGQKESYWSEKSLGKSLAKNDNSYVNVKLNKNKYTPTTAERDFLNFVETCIFDDDSTKVSLKSKKTKKPIRIDDYMTMSDAEALDVIVTYNGRDYTLEDFEQSYPMLDNASGYYKERV